MSIGADLSTRVWPAKILARPVIDGSIDHQLISYNLKQQIVQIDAQQSRF
jgi:hypothetical protein